MDEFWKEAAKWLWGLLLPLGIWIWKTQDKRIEKVEGTMASQKSVDDISESLHNLRNRVVTKEDLKAHEERDSAEFKARREDIKELFGKVDDVKDAVNKRFDDLKDLLLRR